MKKKIVYRFFIFVLFFIVSASGMGIYAHMVAKQLPGEIYLQNNRSWGFRLRRKMIRRK